MWKEEGAREFHSETRKYIGRYMKMSSHIARTEGGVRTVLKFSRKSEINDLVATWFISRPDTLSQNANVVLRGDHGFWTERGLRLLA